MKKLLLAIILIASQLSIAQLGSNAPVHDATNFESTLKYIYTSKQGSGDCYNYINAEVSFVSPLPENHPGPTSSFGYYKYELTFYIYGIDSVGNETLVKTKTRYRNDYNGYPNTSEYGYTYFLNKGAETPFFVGDLPYISYYTKIKITKIITNNDPGYLIFYPEAHWEQKDIYPQPICGGVACATNFVGGLTIPDCLGGNDSVDDNSGSNDTDPNSQPNLTLSKFTVKIGSTTYDTTASTNNIPIFKYGENHTFNITIKNDDNGNASSSNYKILVSEENKYPAIGSKPVYEYQSRNVGGIDGNSEESDSFSEFIYSNISSLNLENDKTYYMFIDIDPNDNVDESNENINDNVSVIQFKYKKSITGKIALKINTSGSKIDVNYEYSNHTNNLKIRDSNYNLRHNSNIYGPSTEVNISSYPSGLYAIYVNDKYIKKIGITKDSDPNIIRYPDEP
ncbi:hypothetical protein [Snuella lapsa]|uniref:CARDB domain-containing protein n=1 Tax=Snuella lapsa TaxID=870481 RepID=A0ABP6YJU4_9FLAO